MLSWRASSWIAVWALLSASAPAAQQPAGSAQQQAGSIRGVVYDKDFDTPLAAVRVTAVETGQEVTTGEQGNYVLGELPPGKYTLVFTREDYVRQVKADVIVAPGRLTDVDVWLAGEFTEMEEFLVQDILQGGAGSEASLLRLRLENPSFLDSIGADLMSRAGASDAASALRLVAGATVQDGRTAVIRGLPDRYVSSQMNSVRLPSADEDKRAVELDQFPAPVIESIQVSKTFTPDQQGDASGGAVDVRLKGIPDETIFQLKGQYSVNSQVADGDFLSYDGGGLSFLGRDDGDRDVQSENLGGNWDGAVGVSTDDEPIDYKWSGAFGAKHELDDGVRIGGFASVFYERDSAFFDDAVEDSWWVDNPGEPMTPETLQGAPDPSGGGDFKTALFDVTQGQQSVQWGGLGSLGVESDNHSVAVTYLYTHIAEDIATLAEDTRGKEFYFPGYDPDDPMGIGNEPQNRAAAPYVRLETLEYTERTTGTLQFHGHHKLPIEEFDVGDLFTFRKPELDWTVASSSADLDQPDKRQFASIWLADSFDPGTPPFVPAMTSPAVHLPFNPSASFSLGNLQRIWKTIDEQSEQYALNLRFPFEQWSGDDGYLKLGVFRDNVDRTYDQDTFSNFGDASASYQADFDDLWSAVFPLQNHPITGSLADVDYDGDQRVSAWYTMMDLPFSASLSAIGGARFESTEISIVNIPEPDATWFPPGEFSPFELNPGDADVDFEQDDVLPSIGLVYEPTAEITLRGAYSQTVARQTFKELTPILQQEYLGGPIFIGNPELDMSALKNYDLRVDYVPYDGSLLSASWFYKDIDDPIEYVQKLAGFTFTTPVNYPEGEMTGYELELRQDLGRFWDSVEGLSIGANATFIDSEVTLPDDEAAGFSQPNILAPMTSRDMTNAPEHLYNIYLTYDLAKTGTQLALFYTVEGDTLVAGAGESNGNFVPNVYAKEYGTLNASLSQSFGKYFKLQLQAKNLTDPEIEEVYRSKYIGDDVTKTSYTKGIEYSIGLSASF